jgi:predicted secreted Zn-dependent protease
MPTATPSPTPPTVPLPKLTGKVKGATKVKYFRVTGDSPDALLDSTVQKSKAACKSDDTLACVLLRPKIHWTDWTRVATGACTIGSPQVDFVSTVHLPRWKSAARVEPSLLAWWKKMVNHMAWHEGQHISIANRYEAKLAKAMDGQRCSAANKIIKKWFRAERAAQAKFDAKDALWAYPEYISSGG